MGLYLMREVNRFEKLAILFVYGILCTLLTVPIIKRAASGESVPNWYVFSAFLFSSAASLLFFIYVCASINLEASRANGPASCLSAEVKRLLRWTGGLSAARELLSFLLFYVGVICIYELADGE